MSDTETTQESVEAAIVEKSRLAHIPLSLIIESEVALRGVDRKSEDYLQLAQSVLKNGVLEPILVREVKAENGSIKYGLINGLQRYTASCDSGLTEIPAHIVEIDDADLMQAQIITNLHRVDTKPAQYSVQLRRLISANPTLTMQDLSKTLSVSVKWLNDRLSLTKLHKQIQDLVDRDELKLANAYALAKLPIDDQINYVDSAMTDSTAVFTASVAQRVKELKDSKRQGREPRTQEFEPIERVQSLVDLKAERLQPTVMRSVLTATGAQTPEDGWKACLDWVLRMDDASVESQRARFEQKKAERIEAQEKAKIEREERKRQRAAEKQQDLMAL